MADRDQLAVFSRFAETIADMVADKVAEKMTATMTPDKEGYRIDVRTEIEGAETINSGVILGHREVAEGALGFMLKMLCRETTNALREQVK